MKLNKREFITLGAGSLAMLTTSAGITTDSLAASGEVDAAIRAFTGGKVPEAGKISLTTPEIVDNGNAVPISFHVASPMTAENYVASVIILADGNPRPGVATFNFTPMSGRAAAATRIRMTKTQNIIAIAKTSTGAVFIDTRQVQVPHGG